MSGLSSFKKYCRRRNKTGEPGVNTKVVKANLDLIEHDGEDLRNLPFLDRQAALARLLCDGQVSGLSAVGTEACFPRSRGSQALGFSAQTNSRH
jgi:ATP-dependent DNA ligase